MRLLLALLAILLSAGCTTANMRRDIEVSGSLPRVIGLGAFAPTCFLFCFVSNETRQGDVRENDIEEPAWKVHDSLNEQLNGRKDRKSNPKEISP